MTSKKLEKPGSIVEDENNNIFEECPACGAIWGCEEFDFQSCNCCGYPDPGEDLNEIYGLDDEDDED